MSNPINIDLAVLEKNVLLSRDQARELEPLIKEQYVGQRHLVLSVPENVLRVNLSFYYEILNMAREYKLTGLVYENHECHASFYRITGLHSYEMAYINGHTVLTYIPMFYEK